MEGPLGLKTVVHGTLGTGELQTTWLADNERHRLLQTTLPAHEHFSPKDPSSPQSSQNPLKYSHSIYIHTTGATGPVSQCTSTRPGTPASAPHLVLAASTTQW